MVHNVGDKVSLELFCGTKSFSKVAASNGFDTFTIDIDPKFNPDQCADIQELRVEDIPFDYRNPMIVWASIPCTTFSICSQWKHWEKRGAVYYPKTDEARNGVRLALKTLQLIKDFQPKYWFIENPCGMLRKMPFMVGVGKRRTVTYCRYGDIIRKPTDIWTNCHQWQPRPICRNGSPCHIPSPRKPNGQGSNRGVRNSRAGPVERSVVPVELCLEIIKAVSV